MTSFLSYSRLVRSYKPLIPLMFIFLPVIGIRVSTLALELVLLGFTWYKTLSRWRTLKTIAPAPLTTMLLRDGTPSSVARTES